LDSELRFWTNRSRGETRLQLHLPVNEPLRYAAIWKETRMAKRVDPRASASRFPFLHSLTALPGLSVLGPARSEFP